jgi:hypothetical protein
VGSAAWCVVCLLLLIHEGREREGGQRHQFEDRAAIGAIHQIANLSHIGEIELGTAVGTFLSGSCRN